MLGGLSLAALTRCAKGEVELAPGPFPLGVACGDATPTGALLWTRYLGVEALRAAVWEGDGDRPADARLFAAPVSPEGFVSTEVEGLTPGRWHRYHFEALDAAGAVILTSTPGRFRTAIAPDSTEPLTFGAVSCTKAGHSFASLLRAAENPALDAFLLLGDIVYTDGSSSRADYEAAWERSIGSPEYRALRASTSTVAIWDDHEVRNNWNGDGIEHPLYVAAQEAFLAHQPLRTDPQARLWRKLSWGRTAELFVLDARSERNHARGEYISPEQLEWLTRGIAESRATFKLVLNTVPIGSFDTAFFQPFKDDTWQACPEQRTAVLRAIDDARVPGVVWLSGDFHMACVGRVSREGPGDRALEVLVGPGAQRANILPSYPSGPQWDFSSGINNYTSLGLEPDSGELRVRYHDGKGKVFFDRLYRP
jgi:alkaline phosphatase D